MIPSEAAAIIAQCWRQSVAHNCNCVGQIWRLPPRKASASVLQSHESYQHFPPNHVQNRQQANPMQTPANPLRVNKFPIAATAAWPGFRRCRLLLLRQPPGLPPLPLLPLPASAPRSLAASGPGRGAQHMHARPDGLLTCTTGT